MNEKNSKSFPVVKNNAFCFMPWDLSMGFFGEISWPMSHVVGLTPCKAVAWLVVFYVPSTRGHLETARPFTVPCEGREARFLHCSNRESNPGSSRGSPLHYRCATPATHPKRKLATRELCRLSFIFNALQF